MPPSLSLPHKGGGTGRGAPRILLRSRIGPRQPRHRRSSSIGQLGRAPTLRAAHEDVAPPQAGCTGELHATHFAGPRSARHAGHAGLDRHAEIAGTGMGIKRLRESRRSGDGSEDHDNGKLARFFFESARRSLLRGTLLVCSEIVEIGADRNLLRSVRLDDQIGHRWLLSRLA